MVSRVGIEHVWRARRATPTCLRITGRNHIEQTRDVVSQIFTSWNQSVLWLRQVDELQKAA
jgi:hypothetical protein